MDAVVVSNPDSLKAKLPIKQKLLIAGLLLVQIPSSLIFYPTACVLALTGIFVPLAIMCARVGTMPLTLAMKIKSDWDADAEQTTATD